MTKSTLEAEAILKRAAPLTHQQAHEIQPFGHLVRMPIALSEQTCKESVRIASVVCRGACGRRAIDDGRMNPLGR